MHQFIFKVCLFCFVFLLFFFFSIGIPSEESDDSLFGMSRMALGLIGMGIVIAIALMSAIICLARRRKRYASRKHAYIVLTPLNPTFLW